MMHAILASLLHSGTALTLMLLRVHVGGGLPASLARCVGAGGGFAALGAGCRRVVPLMVQFPPFGGGNARLEAVCSPKCRPIA